MLDDSLKTRVVVYILLLILLIAGAFLTFYIYQMSNLVEGQLREEGFRLSEDLAFSSRTGVSENEPVQIQPALQNALREEEVKLAAVYNKQGETIISSQKEEIETKMPSEMRKNLTQNKGQSKTKGQTGGGVNVYNFYTPIMVEADEQNPQLVGFARVAISLNEIAVQRRAIFKYGGLVTFLITLAGSIMAYLISVRVTKPLRSLTKGAEEIGKGNLDHRIKVDEGGEIKELAKTFNQMAENLQESRERLKDAKESLEVQVKARTKELRELNQKLEDRVQKRTQELRKRVNELERFHRLTVGREMKMIELKDKIKELKEKLEKYKEGNSEEDEN